MKNLVEEYYGECPELFEVVFHIYDSIERQRVDIDPKEVGAAQSGASFIVCVLCEYAQMKREGVPRQAKG